MEATFESLGLSEAMLKALEKKGYGYPTTIQAKVLPVPVGALAITSFHCIKWGIASA